MFSTFFLSGGVIFGRALIKDIYSVKHSSLATVCKICIVHVVTYSVASNVNSCLSIKYLLSGKFSSTLLIYATSNVFSVHACVKAIIQNPLISYFILWHQFVNRCQSLQVCKHETVYFSWPNSCVAQTEERLKKHFFLSSAFHELLNVNQQSLSS